MTCRVCKENKSVYGSTVCETCAPEEDRKRAEKRKAYLKKWRKDHPGYQKAWYKKNFPEGGAH